jgi:hypothetical protein
MIDFHDTLAQYLNPTNASRPIPTPQPFVEGFLITSLKLIAAASPNPAKT